jgi:iron-sulfur cluster insertion protein
MIITEKASAKIREISESEGIGHTSVRIKILGSGCAGFSFDMEFDDHPSELDEVEVVGEITVIIDPLSFQYIEGITMDYKTSALGSGFAFEGGKVSSKCGCGNSYGFEEKNDEIK